MIEAVPASAPTPAMVPDWPNVIAAVPATGLDALPFATGLRNPKVGLGPLPGILKGPGMAVP